jgi:hypothetical protein
MVPLSGQDVAAEQHAGINVLLCMLKGFALAKPLCGTIKIRL